jgi:hypothetical protein
VVSSHMFNNQSSNHLKLKCWRFSLENCL